MSSPDFTKDKNKDELVRSLSERGSGAESQIKMGIITRCTDEMKDSIKEAVDSIGVSIKTAVDSNDRLSKRVFWLNIILGTFTVVGTVLAIVQLLK